MPAARPAMRSSLMKALYTAIATAEGGRNGRARSLDGILDVELATPKELGGPGGATNPEQLFAAGFAACLQCARPASITPSRPVRRMVCGAASPSRSGAGSGVVGPPPGGRRRDVIRPQRARHWSRPGQRVGRDATAEPFVDHHRTDRAEHDG